MDLDRLKEAGKKIGVIFTDSIPKDVTAKEVILASIRPDRGARVSWKKNGRMFACAPSPSELWFRMDQWKKEIIARPNWTERAEDWECQLGGVFSFLKKTELLARRKTEYDRQAEKENLIPSDFLGLNPQFEEHVRAELAKRGKQSN
jgi:hypothetical protein